jgi:hypothetical protein
LQTLNPVKEDQRLRSDNFMANFVLFDDDDDPAEPLGKR